MFLARLALPPSRNVQEVLGQDLRVITTHGDVKLSGIDWIAIDDISEIVAATVPRGIPWLDPDNHPD